MTIHNHICEEVFSFHSLDISKINYSTVNDQLVICKKVHFRLGGYERHIKRRKYHWYSYKDIDALDRILLNVEVSNLKENWIILIGDEKHFRHNWSSHILSLRNISSCSLTTADSGYSTGYNFNELFSTLKYLKSYLRNTTIETRLNGIS